MGIIAHTQRRKTAANRFDLADRTQNWKPVEVKPDTSLAEYLSQLMPGMEAECEGSNCIRVVSVSVLVERDGTKYCSQNCADQHCAVLIKPQPKTTKVDNWDV